MDSQHRTCKAGDNCHWPRGPKQPLHRFMVVTDRGEKIYYQYCVSCRTHKARQQAELAAKRDAGKIPGPKPGYNSKRYKNLPSNATITPEHQQAIHCWLLGLVIRRGNELSIKNGENKTYYAHHLNFGTELE